MYWSNRETLCNKPYHFDSYCELYTYIIISSFIHPHLTRRILLVIWYACSCLHRESKVFVDPFLLGLTFPLGPDEDDILWRAVALIPAR